MNKICLCFLVMFQSLGLPCLGQLRTIYTLRTKAEKLYAQSKYEQAKYLYKKAYNISLKSKKIDIAANLLVDISSVELLGGEYRKAITYCLQGLSMISDSKVWKDSTRFKLLTSLGGHYQQLNYYDSSTYYFEKAEELLINNSKIVRDIPDYVMYHYSNQALLHEAMGRYTLSINLAEKALEMARRRQLLQDIAILCNVLAGQYERLGKYQKAMKLRKEGLQNSHNWDVQRARIYSGIGRNSYLQKNYKNAIYYLKKSERLYSRLLRADSSQADTRTLANLYNHISQCYLDLRKLDLAEVWTDKALSLYTKKYGMFGRTPSTSWLAKSKIMMARGQSKIALSYSEKALWAVTRFPQALSTSYYPNISDVLDEKAAITAVLNEGKIYRVLKQWSKALLAFRFGLAVFYQAQKQMNLLDDKLYASESIYPLYTYGIEASMVLYKQNRTQQAYNTAFELLEQSRAITLQLISTDIAIQPQYIPLSQREQERKLRQQLASIHTEWLKNLSINDQKFSKNKEIEVKLKHFRLLEKWKQKYPEYYQTRYDYQPITIRQVQSVLTENQAYISYTFQQGKLHVFVITKTSTLWKISTIDSATVYKTINSLLSAVGTHPGLSQYQGTNYSLKCFDWFINPVESLISEKKEWIINTGNTFENIPFEVFETGRRINDYISLTHAIYYVYSARSLLSGKQYTTLPLDSILGLAPFTKPMNKLVNLRFHYSHLKGSEEEVKTIKARWLSGKQATRTNFLQIAPIFPIWYLDTHASINLSEPMQSYIVFFPIDISVSHRLYGDEISGMNLQHTKLIVLSACESGSGKVFQSEGMMSLSRIFTLAGCPSIISPLWNVQDRSSAFMLNQVHSYLEKGYSPAIALQKARINFLTSKENRSFNHPFFWANYRLIGLNYNSEKSNNLILYNPIIISLIIGSICLFLILLLYLSLRS